MEKVIYWKRVNENVFRFRFLKELKVSEIKENLSSFGFNDINPFRFFEKDTILDGNGCILCDERHVYFYFYNRNLTLYYCSLHNQTLMLTFGMENYHYQDDEVSFHFYDELFPRESYIFRVKSLVNNFLELQNRYPYFPVNISYLAYNTHLILSHVQIAMEGKELSLVCSKDKNFMNDHACFRIQNNQTYEDMGYIEFELGDNNFDYDGNVHYYIHKPFRGKGYAIQALALVKALVLTFPEKWDKNLYISVLPENKASSKVALHNGGVLIFDGLVPCDSLLFQNRHIERVHIYKIENGK